MSEDNVHSEGKVAIVTGGGRGIGEAVALALAAEGIALVLASRTTVQLEQVAAKVRAIGGSVCTVAADVSQRDDVARIVDETLRAFGKIDVLVNAAGIYGPIGPVWQVNAEEWMQAMHINLGGTFLCCQAVLPHMIANRRGKIVNFSGGGATSPLPRFTAYGVSKTAIVRLTETLAQEVREFNIQVNAIAPGAVDTAIQDQVLVAGDLAGDLLPRIQKLRETGEGGVPRELPAALVAFLASDRSGELTGKLIAAPYDDWREWDPQRIAEVMSAPWFTLRRMDAVTLTPFVDKLGEC